MNTKIGKCNAHGHTVVVERDDDGNVRASIGGTLIDPLPDQQSTKKTMVTCNSCVEKVNELGLPELETD